MKTRRNQKSRNLKKKTRQAKASASAKASAIANTKRNRRRMYGGFDVNIYYPNATLVDENATVVKDFAWIPNRFVKTVDDDIAISLILDPRDVTLMYPITIGTGTQRYLRIMCYPPPFRSDLTKGLLDKLDPYEDVEGGYKGANI